MKKTYALHFGILIALGILAILVLNVSKLLNRNPLLIDFPFIAYLTYLTYLERNDKSAKTIAFALIILSALLFYLYYFG